MNELSPGDRTDMPTAHRDERPVERDTPPPLPPGSRPRGRRRWGGRMFVLVASVLLIGGIGFGAQHHYSQQQKVTTAADAARDFVPSVRVATVEASPAVMSVILPATTAPFAQANIYARATGYIDNRSVDIGDEVKQGDLLAQLAVPELDDQISQNEAMLNQLKSALEQAQANLQLAQVTWDRDRPVVKKGFVTEQQGSVDVQNLKAQQAAVGVAEANVAAQENQLRVLNQNRDYASVIAPFDGVITQRNIDVGSLVQGNTATGTFMFEIMQKKVIRVFLYVPQDAAFGVTPGIDAIVRVPELPDREFHGKVTRSADALQSATRTLQTEIDIPNADGALPPGVYCNVELKIPRKTPSFIVPAEAIMFGRDGLQVAVVNDGKSEIRKLKVTRDLGTSVEANAGVKAGEQVILNPPVTLVDGGKVQIRTDTTVTAK